MATDEEASKLKKTGNLIYGINNWSQEELTDPSKKLYYTNEQLEQENGQFKCFSCPYTSSTNSAVILHILQEHPKFVHKSPTPLRQTGPRISRTPITENIGRGINTWTKEELSDPNRKLCYVTSNLEKVDGRCKCFCCSYNSTISSSVVKHISRVHPQFVHMPLPARQNPHFVCPRLGINTWTEEELADPKKKLYFTSADLEKVAGRYKCLFCPFSEGNSVAVGKHIETCDGQVNGKFIHKKTIKSKSAPGSGSNKTSPECDKPTVRKGNKRQRRSIPIKRTNDVAKTAKSCPASPTPKRRSLRLRRRASANYADIKLTSESSSYESNSDDEMMDDDGHDEARPENSTLNNDDTEEREFEGNDDDAVLNFTQEAGHDTDMLITDDLGYICASEDVYGIDGPLDFVEHCCSVEVVQDQQKVDVLNKKEDLLLEKLQIAQDRLNESLESLKTKHANEIAKLKEEISKNNGVREVAVPLLDVKEEIDEEKKYQIAPKMLRPFPFKIGGRKSRQLKYLKKNIASKEKTFENLKSKNEEIINQLEYERAKRRESRQREEELTKKLANAESQLKKFKKILELREKQEKLQLEEQLEEQRVREAERVLEERKRAKEERSKEMEIIKAELDITD